MSAWIVFLIVALLFFMAEIYTPTMFFLNFAIASVCCSLLSLITENYNILIPIFVVLSIIFILFLRPLININPHKEKKEYFESQYIGKNATVIKPINAFSGRIEIFDENWEARLSDPNDKEIAAGEMVKITRHDDLTMYVKKSGE